MILNSVNELLSVRKTNNEHLMKPLSANPLLMFNMRIGKRLHLNLDSKHIILIAQIFGNWINQWS